MKIFALLFFLVLPFICFPQNDTVYFNAKWEKAEKDSAKYYGYIAKSGNLWNKLTFFSANNQLLTSGTFLDSNCTAKSGLFLRYLDNGNLFDSIFYERNQIQKAWYFHTNGKKSAYEEFNEGKLSKNLMWNEDGATIDENYRDPTYPSPYKSWTEYLLLSMELDQPKAYRKGKIDGQVVIEFYIGTDGYLRDINVLQSSGHPELDEHARNIIKNSPRWTPARQHGRKVMARREQRFKYPNLSKFED